MSKEYEIKCFHKFVKEFRKLTKKCDTLEEDFNKFIKVLLNDLSTGDKRLTHRRYKQLQGYKDAPAPIFKLKYFRCKGIHKGNRSPFRFIFILDRKHGLIFFVECYFKGNDEKEDTKRISDIFANYEEIVLS